MGTIKPAIIGFGYWGKILYKNLCDMGFDHNTCNIFDTNYRIEGVKNDTHIFVSTPASTHNKIVSELLANNKYVFCEKPLTGTVEQSQQLFKLAQENSCGLFVDWTFLYNRQVEYIKEFCQQQSLGRLKSVNMNRLNLGPIRNDVSAKLDLATHDISILLHILSAFPTNIQWIEYNRNPKGKTRDSCIGLIHWKDIFTQINCSWHYGKKDRTCIFEFEQGFLIWDDITKTITVNNQVVPIENSVSPLQNAISIFINNDYNQDYVKSITLDIEKIISEEYSIIR